MKAPTLNPFRILAGLALGLALGAVGGWAGWPMEPAADWASAAGGLWLSGAATTWTVAVAAVLGTGTELIFPVLLVLGLGARVSAAVLFVFNYIAVVSYPDLNEIGLKDHVYWGILLLVTLLHGPGKIAIDHFIRRKWMPS